MSDTTQPSPSYTYLFGVFSDEIDAVSLNEIVSMFSEQQPVFLAVSKILVLAILEKLLTLLSKERQEVFLDQVVQRNSKQEIRSWLDRNVPDAVLHIRESADLALFSITELL